MVGTPYSERFWSECETWSQDRIKQHQLDALKRQLIRVGERSDYYRASFKQAGFDPRELRSLDDLAKLPLTSKRDFVQATADAPPWGPFLACDPRDIARVNFSSGTTSKPSHMCWTANDIERWSDLFARYFFAQGVRRGDVYQVMVGFAWFVGGLALTQGAQRLGATVIPGGNSDSQRQIETIMRFGVNAMFATPSFAAHLAEVAQQMGCDLSESKVRTIMVGGEPGGGLSSTRARIERQWGAKTFDCYGMIEFQPTAWESEAQSGLVLAEDFVYAEVLDPKTRQPVRDGTPGMLVLTHLDKEACPLVRWSTGDIVVRDSRPGPDGRTGARLVGGVLGRADDMIVVRGVNLFPSSVEEVLRSIPGVASEFQIVLSHQVRDAAGFLTGIGVRVEVENGAGSTLNEAIAHTLREKLLVRAVVETLAEGTLPRAMHKSKRVVQE